MPGLHAHVQLQVKQLGCISALRLRFKYICFTDRVSKHSAVIVDMHQMTPENRVPQECSRCSGAAGNYQAGERRQRGAGT